MRLTRVSTTDALELAAALRPYADGKAIIVAERLNCPPYFPRRTVSALARGTGILLGVAAVLDIPVHLLAPSKWQRAFFGPPPPRSKGLAQSKGATRKKSFVLSAAEKWPKHKFILSDGKADAAWLAEYGLRFLSSVLPFRSCPKSIPSAASSATG